MQRSMHRLLTKSSWVEKFWQCRSSYRLLRTSSIAFAFNQPKGANELQRAAGIASFMRLPIHENTQGLDVCFVGIPWDSGTSNRPGCRFGPRAIRSESALLRPYNIATGVGPFEKMQVADVGDLRVNVYNSDQAITDIREGYKNLLKGRCRPIAVGGDHTISYPILQAIKDKYGPVGLIHVDAHSDTNESMMGEKIAHGTPFRRAVEEELIDPKRTVQIGIRGSVYSKDDYTWPREQGFRIIPAQDCWYTSLTPLMTSLRANLGIGPIYLSFDIDALDPSFAPGTGTPEIAGLTTIQALEIIRGCSGLNIVGADLVEVSPMYDVSGNTALLAANLLFEILCILPGAK